MPMILSLAEIYFLKSQILLFFNSGRNFLCTLNLVFLPHMWLSFFFPFMYCPSFFYFIPVYYLEALAVSGIFGESSECWQQILYPVPDIYLITGSTRPQKDE